MISLCLFQTLNYTDNDTLHYYDKKINATIERLKSGFKLIAKVALNAIEHFQMLLYVPWEEQRKY